MIKKIMNTLGKILLIVSIILIIGGISLFIIGIFNSYNNGIKEFTLFGVADDIYYGKRAINEYLMKSLFIFWMLSFMGILPIICIPIFVAVLLKFKKLFSKNVSQYAMIALIICILLHIMTFYDIFSFYNIGFGILPYAESVIISYIIARKLHKMNSER